LKKLKSILINIQIADTYSKLRYEGVLIVNMIETNDLSVNLDLTKDIYEFLTEYYGKEVVYD